MNFDRSFTLCPPNTSGAAAPLTTEHDVDVDSQLGTCSSSSSAQSLGSKGSPSRPPVASLSRQPPLGPVVIPGTMLLNWEKPSRRHSDEPRRAFRASPFEPLIHQRGLPKNGAITPLKMAEYYANQQELQQSYHHAPTQQESVATTPGSDASGPPVEIRIPSTSFLSTRNTNVETIDYKALYLESQKHLHHVQRSQAQLVRQHRHWQRTVIELQRRLWSVQRCSTTTTSQPNHHWVVPHGESHGKRRRVQDPEAVAAEATAVVPELHMA